jgi:presqualene diphosphate phosphatase
MKLLYCKYVFVTKTLLDHASKNNYFKLLWSFWYVLSFLYWSYICHYFLALIVDIVVIAVLKAIVRRRRPVPMNKLLELGPDKYSFPSGHASRAALVAFLLIFVDPVMILFYPPLLAWVTSVCLSRVLMERHYILDVICGVGLGVLEGLFICLIWFSQSASSSILSSLSDEKRDGGEYHV